jgi:transposase
MAAQLSLPRPTRRRLARLDRATRDADLRIRCRVVLKVAEGLSCRQAAHDLGCAYSTAARIVARFRRHGEAALVDGRSENGNRKVDADVYAGLLKILERRAPAWGFTRPS